MSHPHAIAPAPNSGTPTAICFVRTDISGPHTSRHADEIRRHALGSGYRYVYTVRPPTDKPDPIGYGLSIASVLNVNAIVVFDLAHVDNSPAQICDAGFDLETVCPPTTWTRTTPTADSRVVLKSDDTDHRNSTTAGSDVTANDPGGNPVNCGGTTKLATLHRILDGLTRTHESRKC